MPNTDRDFLSRAENWSEDFRQNDKIKALDTEGGPSNN